MTMNGSGASRGGTTRFDDCECGKQGFKEERGARAHMLSRRQRQEPVDMVACNVGSCFHVFNTIRWKKEQFLEHLRETQKPAGQPRPKFHPPSPLTQRLPLAGVTASVERSPPSPTPTPSAARACVKTKYGSEAMALFALANMPEDHGELRAYECNICRQWHLTSKEYDPSQIVEEMLMAFGHEPHVVTVVAGCYPDGKVASLTLRQSKVYVRIKAENFPQLGDALAYAERRNESTAQHDLRPGKPTKPQPSNPSSGVDRRDRVLGALGAGREMTARELADALAIPPTQMRAMLKRMFKAGLIENGSLVTRSGVPAHTWRLPKQI